MRNFILISAFLLSSLSHANEKQVVPLHKDDPAPFTGVLMDPTTAAKIVAEKEFEKSKCELLIENEKNKQVSKCDLEKMTSEAILKSESEQNKILVNLQEKEIVRLNELLKKEPPAMGPIWYVTGVLSGIVLSVTIFYAAVQITNDPGQD